MVIPIPPTNASVDDLLRFLTAAAKKFPTVQEFTATYNQSHLLDLSNRAAHRIGRAIPTNPPSAGDVEMLDIAQLRTRDSDDRLRAEGAGIGEWTRNNRMYRVETAVVLSNSPTVTIYRGVPRGVKTIDIGDFVALDPAYAHDSGKINNDRYVTISRVVPATDVVNGGADGKEWVYSPRELRRRAVSLRTIWLRAHRMGASDD